MDMDEETELKPSAKRGAYQGEARSLRWLCGPQLGREGALLELEFPGLLILRLLQVLPHADVLIMLVLDLRLHRLQLGVELARESAAQRRYGVAPNEARLPQLSPG